jgi:hypothetical protein
MTARSDKSDSGASLRAEPLIRPGSNSNKHSNSPSSLSSRNNRNSHLHTAAT